MYIINSKLKSTFGTISKATGVKMTAKAVGKNSNFCVSVKNYLNMWLWTKWKETRDRWNTVTLIPYKRYTIKSKLTTRCDQRYMCDSSSANRFHPSQSRADSPSNWKRLPNCQNQYFSYLIYSTIPSSNRGMRQDKIILKCIIIIHSGSDHKCNLTTTRGLPYWIGQ